MEASFWHAKWEQNHIGFHEPVPHRYLVSYYSSLDLAAGDTVFAPLCGKSIDLCWLADQQLNVLGIELSEIAIQDFFTENNLVPSKSQLDSFTCWTANNITLLQGDFFDLQSQHLASCKAVYDRAALIALPKPTRVRYAHKLKDILPKQTRTLAISLEYPQHEKSGPPFSVDAEELSQLFNDKTITKLASEDVLSAHPHFEKNGMTQLIESVYCW